MPTSPPAAPHTTRAAVRAAVTAVLAARSPGVAVRAAAADSDLDAAGIIATELPRTADVGGVTFDYTLGGVTVTADPSEPATVPWVVVAGALRGALGPGQLRQAARFAAAVADPDDSVDPGEASRWIAEIAATAADQADQADQR